MGCLTYKVAEYYSTVFPKLFSGLKVRSFVDNQDGYSQLEISYKQYEIESEMDNTVPVNFLNSFTKHLRMLNEVEEFEAEFKYKISGIRTLENNADFILKSRVSILENRYLLHKVIIEKKKDLTIILGANKSLYYWKEDLVAKFYSDTLYFNDLEALSYCNIIRRGL